MQKTARLLIILLLAIVTLLAIMCLTGCSVGWQGKPVILIWPGGHVEITLPASPTTNDVLILPPAQRTP